MTVLRSTLAAVTAALLAVPLLASPASAAPAPNDTAASATVVSVLPTTVTQDTTGATTDALDAQLNQQCGAPFTNASVWFRYTGTGDGVVADMSQSSYSGGFLVTEGNPSQGLVVACGPTTVGFTAAAGQDYWIVAFSDTTQQGGTLVATFDVAPPAPEISFTLNPRGTAYKDGSAKLSGTYSCTNAQGELSDIEGTLTQRVGRVKITGFFFLSPIECDGTTRTWEAVVTSDTGLFRGGKGATVAFAFACGVFECSVGYAEQAVQLSTSKK